MSDKEFFSQEPTFKEHIKNVVEKWWQQVNLGEFTGVDDIRINYASFYLDENKRDLVISPGRCESFFKYKELCYDFSQQGYNIYILDHRGQGTSQRILSNKHKGYVQKFDHYAQDLYTFIDTVVISNKSSNLSTKPPYLLAHSMGGAIALRMLELYPNSIQAALLSSPMLAINSGNIPPWLAKYLTKSAQYINKLIGKMQRDGFTLVPTKMYFKKGKAKIELAVAKGKKQYDKRATKKSRDWNREKARYIRKSS